MIYHGQQLPGQQYFSPIVAKSPLGFQKYLPKNTENMVKWQKFCDVEAQLESDLLEVRPDIIKPKGKKKGRGKSLRN